MAQFKEYRIKGTTLDNIANAIKSKFGFNEEINPENFPLYISNDSNEFWLTHYNQSLEGGGCIFTGNSSVPVGPSEVNAVFEPDLDNVNAYKLKDLMRSVDSKYGYNRYVKSDLNVNVASGRRYSSFGNFYTLHGTESTLYDDGVKLTDGVTNTFEGASPSYSAWHDHATNPLEITIDLGSIKKIGKCVLHGDSNFWGIKPPTRVDMLIRENESDAFKLVATQTANEIVGEGREYTSNGVLVPSQLFTMTLELERELINARYVQLRVYGVFIWLDELEIFSVNESNVYKSYMHTIDGVNVAPSSGKVIKYTNIDSWNSYVSARNDCFSVVLQLQQNGCYKLIGSSIYDQMNYVEGDVIITCCDLVNNIDILPFLTNSENYPFVITSTHVELLFKDDLTFENNISCSDNEFIYKLKVGTNDSANVMAQRTKDWAVGDTFVFENIDLETNIIPTDTPMLNHNDSNYNCTATYDKLQNFTITIDGDLSDSGWRPGGWYDVSSYNGTYVSTSMGALNYKYKIKTDENYLYVALASEKPLNLNTTEEMSIVRFWIKSDNSDKFTHAYGLDYEPSKGLFYIAKTPIGNGVTNITPTSLEGAYISNENGFTVELKVLLSEFGGQSEFDYFMSHSNVVDGKVSNLFNGKLSTFPYVRWDNSADTHVITEDEELSSDFIQSVLSELI